MKQVLALCLLASCSSVAVDDGASETASKFSIALPPRYAHWRDIFEKQFNDLRASQSDFLERWTEVDSGPLHLVLLESPLAAQKYYLANNLSGRADTPRTFIDRRLSLLVLPADDRLLAELPSPPQTILHDFRHEASHLISCDYPELFNSPKWFQEGWAEMWAPINKSDVSEWPHAHDIYRWFERLDWNNLASAPAEVRYSFMAHAAELCLRNSPSAEPWALKPAIDLQNPGDFKGLRGRHAFWDIENSHYLLSSMPNSQVDLDLPYTWDGVDDLILKMRVGATSSPIAGVVLYSHDANISETQLLRIPIDVDGGINAYLDTVDQMLIRPLHPAPDKQKFGAWRTVRLRRTANSIVVSSVGFERVLPLVKDMVKYPLAIRMYSRNGSFELKHEEILN